MDGEGVCWGTEWRCAGGGGVGPVREQNGGGGVQNGGVMGWGGVRMEVSLVVCTS